GVRMPELGDARPPREAGATGAPGGASRREARRDRQAQILLVPGRSRLNCAAHQCRPLHAVNSDVAAATATATSTQTTNWPEANPCRREPPRHHQNPNTAPIQRPTNAHRTPVLRRNARPTATHQLLRRPRRYEARSQRVEMGL